MFERTAAWRPTRIGAAAFSSVLFPKRKESVSLSPMGIAASLDRSAPESLVRADFLTVIFWSLTSVKLRLFHVSLFIVFVVFVRL